MSFVSFISNARWRIHNKNNGTQRKNSFPMSQVSVGYATYGDLYVICCGLEYFLNIGSYCSIAQNVKFILEGDHRVNTISSYPYKVKILEINSSEAISNGDITVGDDVWIGENTTILSGVHIHQGAVIAAGAVVTKDVPPYAVVGGVPAKVIKYRFQKPVIDVLMTIDYSKLTKEMIQEHIDDLYDSLDGLSAEEVEKKIAWMPKKEKS